MVKIPVTVWKIMHRRQIIMKTVIFVVASVFLYAGTVRGGSYSGPKSDQCPRGEVRAPCGSVCEPTCCNPNPQFCPFMCITNGCRCQPGLLRDECSGRCVFPTQCRRRSISDVIVVENSCGPNESVAPCGPVCEPSCSNPNPTVCTANCIINGCRCNPGFFRDRFGRCVDYYGCFLRG